MYKERKRKKKSKKHIKKAKKVKTANYDSDSEEYSSENELQWIERKDLATVQPPPSLKHEDWMTVPVPPSSRSLDELTRRKELEEDTSNTTEVCRRAVVVSIKYKCRQIYDCNIFNMGGEGKSNWSSYRRFVPRK